MMRKFTGLFSALYFLCFFADAEQRVKVVYTAPESPSEQVFRDSLQSSQVFESSAELIDEQFNIPKQLTLVIGGEDGPLYDPGTNKIYIPYFFVDEVQQRFEKANYQETGVSPEEATEDALMHTVFHEFAHAAIAMYDIPVLGREEDAADALANVMLIEFFEQGQEIALSAADLFDLESDDREVLEDDDFSGEHSLDDQRYFSLLCHIYGSNPEKYSSIEKQGILPPERADMCIDEYQQISASWITLLTPYLRQQNRED